MKKWILFLFWTVSLHADVINQVQTDILQNYIPTLEEKFGYCGDKTCIEFRDGKYYLNLPKKEICLPWTACSFYDCMEEKYNCEDQGVNYFTELAVPTCSKYMENIKNDVYSPEARDWVYEVMVCLQKGLIDECEVGEKCDLARPQPRISCNYIVDFTLEFHPGCYINSGVGVCNLSFRDKWRIWKTIHPFMTKREKRQAWKVIWYCLFPNKSEMPRGF